MRKHACKEKKAKVAVKFGSECSRYQEHFSLCHHLTIIIFSNVSLNTLPNYMDTLLKNLAVHGCAISLNILEFSSFFEETDF